MNDENHTPYNINKDIDSQSQQFRFTADTLKARLVKSLLYNGYKEEYISLEDNPANSSLFVSFLPPTLIQDKNTANFIRAFKSKSVDSVPIKLDGLNRIKHEIYLSSLTDFLDSMPNIQVYWETVFNEVINIIQHLDTKIFHEMEDETPPSISFLLNDNVLQLEFTYENGEPMLFDWPTLDRFCIMHILTEEDYKMAEYLLELNSLPVEARQIFWVMGLLEFEALQKFGYPLSPEKEDHREYWFKHPNNLIRYRKDKISKILNSL